MIVATFYGLDDDAKDERIGTLTLDGERLTADPAGPGLLADVAEEVGRAGDKAAAMRNLPHRYTSAYLRAAVEEGK